MQGWECPKCGKCYAPHVDECKRCVGDNRLSEGIVIPPYPPTTTGGTINISIESPIKTPSGIANAIYGKTVTL